MSNISSTTSAPVTNDTFLFIYELDPAIVCSNFRHDSDPFTQANPPLNVRFSVWQEMLAISYNTVKGAYEFDSISAHAHSTVNAIMATYAFFTMKPLQFTRRNWIEYEGSLKNLVIGKFEAVGNPDASHADNQPFKELNSLMPLILNNTALAGTLKDFYSCSSRTDPDFYFYAFRAAEDIRSYFVSSEDGQETKPAWKRMNEALGREEKDYATLKELGTKSRHRNLLGESIDQGIAYANVLFVQSLISDFIKYLVKVTTPKVVAAQPTKIDNNQNKGEPTET